MFNNEILFSMKNSIKIILLLITALAMAGCEVGEGELMKTKTGHLMYNGWCDDVNNLLLQVVEPAFNLYAWTQAPEGRKQEVFSKYFRSSIEIEELSDRAWIIRTNQGSLLRMSLEYGPDLSLPGGQMRLFYVGSYRGDVLNDIIFILENKGDSVWEIRSEDGSIRFELALGISGIPESVVGTVLSVEGQGMFTHKAIYRHCSGDVCEDEVTLTFLSYDIRQPFEGVWNPSDRLELGAFVKESRRMGFVSGKVGLQALDENGVGNAATVTVLSPEEIEIEMDGVVQRRKI